MDFEEIAKMAYMEKEEDKYWNLPKKYAYFKLKQLYFNYKIGKYSKETSIAEKAKIKGEYLEAEKNYENELDVYKKYNRNRLENTILLSKLEKTRDKEEALKYSIKIIQNCISDKDFERRICEKLELKLTLE